MGFAIEKLGIWTAPREFKIEAERTQAYAAATNDPIEVHRDGTVAPPLFAVVPVWDVLTEAMASVVPPEAFAFVVHGEQDIRYHQPIKPGSVLSTKAAPIGVHVKASGTTVVCKADSVDQDGTLIIEQYFITFFRGVSDGEGAGKTAPGHTLTDEIKATGSVGTIAQTLDTDQTFRYADASGDRMPIHLDEEFARNVGLPGIIIHGLCTMAFTSWAAITTVGNSDPSKVQRLAVRFSKPVLPGETITTTFYKVGEGDGITTFAYETVNQDGAVVIKDGLIEVRD